MTVALAAGIWSATFMVSSSCLRRAISVWSDATAWVDMERSCLGGGGCRYPVGGIELQWGCVADGQGLLYDGAAMSTY